MSLTSKQRAILIAAAVTVVAGAFIYSQLRWYNGKWGYGSKEQELVIFPQFVQARPFSEGRAAVIRTVNESIQSESIGYWGYIDTNGEPVTEFRFEDARPFAGGHAPILLDGKWGLIDRNGNITTPPQFDDIRITQRQYDGPDGSRQRVITINAFNERWGVINPQGEWLIEPRFDTLLSFVDGFSAARIGAEYRGMRPFGGKVGVIGKQGEWLIEPQFDDLQIISPDWRGGSLFAKVADGGWPASDETSWGIVDKRGQYVVDPTYAGLIPLGEVVFAFNRTAPGDDLMYGLLSNTGEVIVPVAYQAANCAKNKAPIREWNYIHFERPVSRDGNALPAELSVDSKGNKISISEMRHMLPYDEPAENNESSGGIYNLALEIGETSEGLTAVRMPTLRQILGF